MHLMIYHWISPAQTKLEPAVNWVKVCGSVSKLGNIISQLAPAWWQLKCTLVHRLSLLFTLNWLHYFTRFHEQILAVCTALPNSFNVKSLLVYICNGCSGRSGNK